ncbi:MAG: type I restriction endonuclease subunit R, partial [bacterium]|nr:type I restriction endonuclease subunit R [bacterium]
GGGGGGGARRSPKPPPGGRKKRARRGGPDIFLTFFPKLLNFSMIVVNKYVFPLPPGPSRKKIPFVLDSIGEGHRSKKFAIIVDEAHSSQGGRTAAAMSMALSEGGAEQEDETTEDKINRIIESRKLLPNASYFAFTATPKNKTLELFGIPYTVGDEVKHRPFHGYTMKQAIQEGFILDVLKYYTPVDSYYRLAKTVEGDPEFDVKKARKKLRVYVESHSKAIRDKAEIMVDHFFEQVIGRNKIGGKARAMVVTGSIQRAIQYFFAFRDYLTEMKSPYKSIVAFSG